MTLTHDGHRRLGAVACLCSHVPPSPSEPVVPRGGKVRTQSDCGRVAHVFRFPSPGQSGLYCTSTSMLELACGRSSYTNSTVFAHREDGDAVRVAAKTLLCIPIRGRRDERRPYSRRPSETERRYGVHLLAGTHYVCSTCSVSVSDAGTVPVGVLTTHQSSEAGLGPGGGVFKVDGERIEPACLAHLVSQPCQILPSPSLYFRCLLDVAVLATAAGGHRVEGMYLALHSFCAARC